jgi:hypothetical protein
MMFKNLPANPASDSNRVLQQIPLRSGITNHRQTSLRRASCRHLGSRMGLLLGDAEIEKRKSALAELLSAKYHFGVVSIIAKYSFENKALCLKLYHSLLHSVSNNIMLFAREIDREDVSWNGS